MKMILLATDGSDHAGAALEICATLARQHAAEVLAVHVVTDRQPTEEARHAVEVEFPDQLVERCRGAMLADKGPDDGAALAKLIVSRQSDIAKVINSIMGENILHRAAARLGEQHIGVTTRLTEGEPAECLLEIAATEACDTIVIGCRGMGKLAGVLLGSVSQSVAHRADCHVVMVK